MQARTNKVVEITNADQYKLLLRDNPKLVIFYGAKWCDACTKIIPLYTGIANKYYKRITMVHVDIEVCKLDFSRIPVFVAMKDGKQIKHMVGGNDEGLKELVREAILFENVRVNSRNTVKPKILSAMIEKKSANSAQEYQLHNIPK